MPCDKSVIAEKEKNLIWEAPKIMKISQEQAWAICYSNGNNENPAGGDVCDPGGTAL